jgi:hypothetical protein
MQNKIDVEKTIDGWNEEFTSQARKPLADLSQYSTESLEWLMMEHYQFSFRNCEFLWNAAETTGAFDTDAVEKELVRNHKEESGHAALYKMALKKVGSDVDTRTEFAPTTRFLEAVGQLCLGEPSTVLGAMFATETAAIFEHQVFKAISAEVVARRGAAIAGKPLLHFHQMHLDGVEQSHKDELGIFLRGVYADQPVVAKEGNRPTLYPQQVLAGGKQAVELMKAWWAELFAALNAQKRHPRQGCLTGATHKPMSVAQRSKPVASTGHQFRTVMPRELEIVLNGPVGPQRLREDTRVITDDGWYRTITPSTSWPAANEVLFSNLDARQADAQIDALIAEYHQLGLPVTWCVYPWTQPADLGERLRARGATTAVIQALLSNTASPLKLVDGVQVEQIDPTSTESYDAYMQIIAAGYDLPADELAFRRQRYRELSSGPMPRMQLFLGRYRGVVAGCAATIIKEDSGHMTGVHVLREFQARGVFQSLIVARLKVLREMGIALATGHSNEQSAFWAMRFGFNPIYSYTIYQLDPPAVVS